MECSYSENNIIHIYYIFQGSPGIIGPKGNRGPKGPKVSDVDMARRRQINRLLKFIKIISEHKT
jgi:hypothetical protein